MIRVTGVFADKTYEKPTAVTAKALAERFGCDLPTQEKALQIALSPRQIKRDVFRQERMPHAIYLQTTIDGTDPKTGDSLTITYIPTRGGKGRVRFSGGVQLYGIDRTEEAVFLQLSPRFKTSPFRPQGGPFELEMSRPEVANQARLELRQQVLELQNRIIQPAHLGGLPFSAIEIRARGMNVQGHTFGAVLAEGESATRLRLCSVLDQFPAQFIKEWGNEKSETEGYIRWALDKGLIVWGTNSSGAGYFWRPDVRNGKKIVPVRENQDGLTELLAQAFEDHGIILTIKGLRANELGEEALDLQEKEEIQEEIDARNRKELSVEERKALTLRDAETYGLIAFDADSCELWKTKGIERIEKICDVDADLLADAEGDWTAVVVDELKGKAFQSIQMRVNQAKGRN